MYIEVRCSDKECDRPPAYTRLERGPGGGSTAITSDAPPRGLTAPQPPIDYQCLYAKVLQDVLDHQGGCTCGAALAVKLVGEN